MNASDQPKAALTFVNLLVPSGFAEAEKWLSEKCEYRYQDQVLKGPSVINAFRSSHAKAMLELDSIEYLPGSIKEVLPDGVLISVADKIGLNGKFHVYRDQLKVRIEQQGEAWRIVGIQHLPIPEEREQLRLFLEEAGPRLKSSAFEH